MKGKAYIIAKLTIEGLHHWPEAQRFEPKAYYLQYIHRHQFVIRVKKLVNHDDRDVEFIVFAQEIKKAIRGKFGKADPNQLIDFGSMSCEMIAKWIAEKFECCEVSVMEDNENGAVFVAE